MKGARSERASWAVVALGGVGVLVLLLAENLGAGPLDHLLLYLPGVDKVLHVVQSFAIFHGLYWLIGRTRLPATQRLMAAAVGALAAATVDEAQQWWLGGRHVEVADIVAGSAGVLLGLATLVRSRRAGLATTLAVFGILAGAGVTYDSYRTTRDYKNGLLAERQGRRDDARRHYQKGVEAGIRDAGLYNALAWSIAEFGEGDSVEAVTLAEQSLRLSPGNADVLDTYGWALYRAGRPADALLALEEALALKPDIYCIHYHLGVVYLELGRQEDGIRHLRRQIALRPEVGEARLSAQLLATLTDGWRPGDGQG